MRRLLIPETFPRIVCLCGSTRFIDVFHRVNFQETINGKIVLTVGCDTKEDSDFFAMLDDAGRTAIKARLDELHKRKIDLADEVLVLNVGGYIGESTRAELEYAKEHGKRIRFLEDSTDNFKDAAVRLFDLLDEVDTASDRAKGDNDAYLSLVDAISRKRFEIFTTDGYELFTLEGVQITQRKDD